MERKSTNWVDGGVSRAKWFSRKINGDRGSEGSAKLHYTEPRPARDILLR